MKRYELPNPPAGKLNDIHAWQDSLNNSKAQLEHQFIRIQNLDLMSVYGAEAWKLYIQQLTKISAKISSELEVLRKQIQDINLQRKTKQTKAGEKLAHLHTAWVSLVGKNFEIERAINQLEIEATITERRAAKRKEKDLDGENDNAKKVKNADGSGESPEESQEKPSDSTE